MNINLTLFDFFKVPITIIDAKAVIINKKKAKITLRVISDLKKAYYSLYL